MTRAALLLCALALGLSALPAGPARAGSRCSAAKYQGAGRYLQSVARCQAKAAMKGAPLDPLCVAKAQTKLGAAFASAEKKGDCLTLGDAVPAQDVVDDVGGELWEILLPPAERRCCYNPGACFWAENAADCQVAGVTLGEVGSVCDGDTRTCVAPPPTGVSLCCENVTSPELSTTTCMGDPMLTCAVLGGDTVDDAVCHRSKRCLR